MMRFLLNLSITPLLAEEWNKFMPRFLLKLSITPLPAEELNVRYAAFLTEFVYYFLTSWRIKINFMLRFLLNLSVIKSGVLCLFSFLEDRY